MVVRILHVNNTKTWYMYTSYDLIFCCNLSPRMHFICVGIRLNLSKEENFSVHINCVYFKVDICFLFDGYSLITTDTDMFHSVLQHFYFQQWLWCCLLHLFIILLHRTTCLSALPTNSLVCFPFEPKVDISLYLSLSTIWIKCQPSSIIYCTPYMNSRNKIQVILSLSMIDIASLLNVIPSFNH